jgi:hypothetical protein
MLAAEPTEMKEAAEPAEPTEPTEPAEPIERIEPADPIERIEPADPIDKMDPLDPRLRIELEERAGRSAGDRDAETARGLAWGSTTRSWPSEPGELGVRRVDPFGVRTEVDDHGAVVDVDDPAEAIPVVGDLVVQGKLLDRPLHMRSVEGTSGQVAPVRGAGWLHHY